MRENKGYTLIEMIIVIAIMAVLSGMAFYTYGIVKKAKCNAAVDTFDNQLTSLWIKTKAISQGKVQTAPRTSEDSSKYPLCMIIEENTDSSDDIRDGSYCIWLGYNKGTTYTKATDDPEAILPEFIEIDFESPTDPGTKLHTAMQDGTLGTTGTQDIFVIQFNKSDGSVEYGNGKYHFYYNDREYGTVVLNRVTGNHYHYND